MIPVGKCMCMACNSVFPIDEAVYRIPINLQAYTDAQKSHEEHASDFLDGDEMFDEDTSEEFNDGNYDDHYESQDYSAEMPVEDHIEVSLSELLRNGFKESNGVRVRLLADGESIQGKTSLNPKKIDGHKYFETVYFAYSINGGSEVALEGLRSYRTCKECGKPLGESMGFMPNYLIMMFGNSTSGKTTWLKTVYDSLSIDSHIQGYTFAPQDNNEKQWTRESIKVKLQGEVNDEKLKANQIQAEQETLCAYFRFNRGSQNVNFVFRDIAGELLSHERNTNIHAERVRDFAQYSDGLLVFRDFLCLPGIIERYLTTPAGSGIDKSYYKSAIEAMLMDLGVEPNDIFKNREISHAFSSLHIPSSNNISILYVFNKSDLLFNMVNRSIEGSDYEGIVPFDYMANSDSNRLVITSDDPIFRDIDHSESFDMRGYLDCAISTNHVVSREDSAFVAEFSRYVNAQKCNKGMTCISSNPKDPKRVFEPLAWLMECLLNERDFSMSLAEQSDLYVD